MTALNLELKTYSDRLPSLMGQLGKHVLIKGNDIIGVFDSYEDALRAGYEKFNLEPFLVKKIAPSEQVAFFAKAYITGCPA